MGRKAWKRDAKARAHARAIASEMHAGFQGLRQACPMNLTKRFKTPALTDQIKADVARLEAMWAGARARFGSGGPFLLGAFSAADAMFAPVVTRLDTYQIPVSPETRAYMDTVLGHPAFVLWRTQAAQETWKIEHYEDGHTPA